MPEALAQAVPPNEVVRLTKSRRTRVASQSGFADHHGSPKALAAQATLLQKLECAKQMLAEARTLPEVKKIRDVATAARVYAQAAHLGREAMIYAGEVKLASDCKAGELLARLDKSEGGRPKKTPASVAGVSEYAQVLDETHTPERTARHWS
ncbi:MAG: hypothetical protein ACRD40_11885, partial [Candidatus Acidiferrales bacterium]